jgi:tetratricopeptide (TPR) repeat protein
MFLPCNSLQNRGKKCRLCLTENVDIKKFDKVEQKIDIGDRYGEGMAYSNFGNVYHELEDFNKAIEYHTKALNMCIDNGDDLQKEQ